MWAFMRLNSGTIARPDRESGEWARAQTALRQFSIRIDFSGGAEGNRTPDLYNAIVALSQLSYGPNLESGATGEIARASPRKLPREAIRSRRRLASEIEGQA